MYAIAIKHPASSDIGKIISYIAQSGTLSGLFEKLPKKYRQKKSHQQSQNLPQIQDRKMQQRQKYQSQLSSILDTNLSTNVGLNSVGSSRNIYHPMRMFGRDNYDLSSQFNGM